MATISASVGRGGSNHPVDVRTVQRLLNQHNVAPLKLLQEDGQCGPLTIAAIRHFQARYVGMSSPDERVDPNGRTLRMLQTPTAPRTSAGNAETRRADRQLRSQLVDPRVKEIGRTTQIIDRLLPHMSRIRARIISGYLSDSDLYWKVNWHWEYLLDTIERCIQIEIAEESRQALMNLRARLLACAPDPRSGYTSGPVGRPEDRTSQEAALQRHRILSQCKREFQQLSRRERLESRSNLNVRVIHLAAAPVAAPTRGKHSTGYALDIEGDNQAIGNVCRSQGATLVFDERSHVHVEFANG